MLEDADDTVILPIRTNIRPRRTPYANLALIVVNIIVFSVSYWPHLNPFTGAKEGLRPWAEQFMLNPVYPRLWQFVSYAFLHAGLLHIFGNMYFLYLFGNNVNDKLGNIGYLCLYLGGAVFAGVGHALLHENPVLGASGAVAAVTGAYLVLFPQSLITILVIFFFIGTMELSALYFILFKLIVWDNIIEARLYASAVAYGAHLAGYAFGIFAMVLLLSTGLIGGSGFDLWSMMRQWNRRRRFRDVVSNGYDPFTGGTPAKRINAREIRTPDQKQQDEKIQQLRNEIAARVAQHNLSAAAELYLELMELDREHVLPRQYLLDIANQLASKSKHAESAQAYEKFLLHYPTYEYVEQVELMLGVLYSRYLREPQLAIKHLEAALENLSDPGQRKMCRDELAKLQQ
ncbi:MAG TPA: rhomboid family intramembrane serine protease [Sedimentisphaerales bacterium]|nr:rhomboid family intramembrane serine protease [Sedimentisphaerales bacterium]